MWPERTRQHPAPDDPYGWWGYGWRHPEPLSVVQLIEAGNFDARTAALLWLMLGARASIIVAADPPGAGKTTTLTALADFLPPAVERIYLRGRNETFAFAGHSDPARGYLLCNEISPHLPVYLWGQGVGRLFAAVGAGYGVGVTMHAESLAEVAAILEGRPLFIPRPAIARLDLLLTLAVDYSERRPRRRLAALTLLRRDGVGNDFDPATLAHWDPARDAIVHADGPPTGGLTRRIGLAAGALTEEWERRAAFLSGLSARGVRTVPDVRQALAGLGAED